MKRASFARHALALALGLLLVGCGSSDDGKKTTDGGGITPGTEAGVTPGTEAGVTPGYDTGIPGTDSYVPRQDSYLPPLPDTGTPGTMSCAQVFTCAKTCMDITCVNGCTQQVCASGTTAVSGLTSCAWGKCLDACKAFTPECDACLSRDCSAEQAACNAHSC